MITLFGSVQDSSESNHTRPIFSVGMINDKRSDKISHATLTKDYDRELTLARHFSLHPLISHKKCPVNIVLV